MRQVFEPGFGWQLLSRLEDLPFGRLLVFSLKQAWAAIFGILMLCAIVFTSFVDLPWISQFDWLFIFAIISQIAMIASKLERPREAWTILLFHLVGLGMELFKTSDAVGSWSYSGHAFFQLANVPLFSGFMYASVGSYIARTWRLLDLRFDHYPASAPTILIAILIYINFFTHHYFYDIRLLLFIAIFWLYRRTTVRFKLIKHSHHLPLLLNFGLIALLIWLAENIGTLTNTWLYPNQHQGWQMVGWQKIGAWFLLMIISFVMVKTLRNFENKSAELPAKNKAFKD